MWPKSRYTASLEDQVRDLKAEVLRLQQQNNELAQYILNQRSAAAVDPPRASKDKKELPLPTVVNWLRARSELETPNSIVTEAEPKEKSANGTR
jgi:hypothetical protein